MSHDLCNTVSVRCNDDHRRILVLNAPGTLLCTTTVCTEDVHVFGKYKHIGCTISHARTHARTHARGSQVRITVYPRENTINGAIKATLILSRHNQLAELIFYQRNMTQLNMWCFGYIENRRPQTYMLISTELNT